MEYIEKVLSLECLHQRTNAKLILYHEFSSSLEGFAEDLFGNFTSAYNQYELVGSLAKEFSEDGDDLVEDCLQEALEYFEYNILGMGHSNPALFLLEAAGATAEEILYDQEGIIEETIQEFDPFIVAVSEKNGDPSLGVVYDYKKLLLWARTHYSLKNATEARSALLNHIKNYQEINYPFYMLTRF